MSDRERNLINKFWAFHKANPHVYGLFKRFTFEIIKRGHRHHSAEAIIHRIRWHVNLETVTADFKMNNNYAAFYARLFHRDYPEHARFFRKKVSTADLMFLHKDGRRN